MPGLGARYRKRGGRKAAFARRRKVGGRRYRRSKYAPKKGSMFVTRLCRAITCQASGVGTVAISSNNSVFLGTPVAEPYGVNMYAVPFSIVFRLDELQNYTEMTNLFDAFKLVFAKVKVLPTLNAATQTNVPVPYLQWVVDHDDGATPSTTAFREKMGVITKYANTYNPGITMTCAPRVAIKVQTASLSTGNALSRATWINSIYPETEHYAIKGVIRNYNLATANTNHTLDSIMLRFRVNRINPRGWKMFRGTFVRLVEEGRADSITARPVNEVVEPEGDLKDIEY